MKLNEKQKELITEAIGTASMCWNPRPGNQVFDSTEAVKVRNQLIEDLEKEMICPVCQAIENKEW